jgi:hypothetical protein
MAEKYGKPDHRKILHGLPTEQAIIITYLTLPMPEVLGQVLLQTRILQTKLTTGLFLTILLLNV